MRIPKWAWFTMINPILFLISYVVGFIPGLGMFLSLFFYYDAYLFFILKYLVWASTYMKIGSPFIVGLLNKYYLLICFVVAALFGLGISYFVSWLWKKESCWQNILYSYLFTLVLAPILPLMIFMLPIEERVTFIPVFFIQLLWAIAAFSYLWIKYKHKSYVGVVKGKSDGRTHKKIGKRKRLVRRNSKN